MSILEHPPRGPRGSERGPHTGKRVVILGLGQFGGQIEAARHFVAAGARVLATDVKGPEKLGKALQALAGLPIEMRLGGHREEDLLGADLIVVSPAVPRSSPFWRLILERGLPWTTELLVTLGALRAPVVAITGSNGKSTTTALLGRALEAGSGRPAHVGGNIGRPLVNLAGEIGPEEWVALELSSFQLEDLRDAAGGGTFFAPRCAIVTNLTPNHLDRHGTMEAYSAAKRHLVERIEPGGAAVLNRADPLVQGFATACRGTVYGFGVEDRDGPGSFRRGDAIVARDAAGRESEVARVEAMRLPGRHNVENALAVTAAALALGLDLGRVGREIEAFEGLQDRLEAVRERRGVRFVNDSKATTPEAVVAGLASFPPGLTLIAGGADKGMDFTPFARAAVERAALVLLIGQTRGKLADEIGRAAAAAGRAAPEVEPHDTLEGAVERAAERTPAGSAVLFSPGCASYDMFLSFEERGERFRRAVGALSD